jgi:uroporphyrinogen-III synthase
MNHSLNNIGIAITRPVEQAKKLNALINHHGCVAISFPLIDIVPLANYSQFDDTLNTIDDYDWAIFISSNAVQNGMPRLLSKFSTLPPQLQFAAIGPATAAELTQMGAPQVLIPKHRFDSESLLSLPEMQAMQDKRVMIFRGIGGREVLADTLKARGAQVTFAECYQRVNPQSDCLFLEQLWQNKQCHAIVVTSSEAMRHLLEMTNNGNDTWIRNIAICVNHARIAEEALLTGAADLHLTIADAPGDEAMLACIQLALAKTLNKP